MVLGPGDTKMNEAKFLSSRNSQASDEIDAYTGNSPRIVCCERKMCIYSTTMHERFLILGMPYAGVKHKNEQVAFSVFESCQ